MNAPLSGWIDPLIVTLSAVGIAALVVVDLYSHRSVDGVRHNLFESAIRAAIWARFRGGLLWAFFVVEISLALLELKAKILIARFKLHRLGVTLRKLSKETRELIAQCPDVVAEDGGGCVFVDPLLDSGKGVHGGAEAASENPVGQSNCQEVPK